MKCPRLLLADDHRAILDTVARLLGVDFDVVGAVEDGEQAVQAVIRLDPDVVVLDISMPVVNGIEAASRVKQSGSRAKVIFLTAQTNPEFVRAAFTAGALGYVVKTRLMTDLAPAIREVLEGGVFVSPSLDVDEMAGIRPPAEVQHKELEPVAPEEARSQRSRPMPVTYRRPLSSSAWRPAWLAAGAVILAAMITTAVFHERQQIHPPPSSTPTDAQQRQSDELKQADSALRDNLDQLGQVIARQQQEMQSLHEQLKNVAKTTDDQRRNGNQMRAELEQSATRNMQLLAELGNREKALAEAKADLERIARARVEEQASFAEQQFRINELSEQLRITNANLEMERQLVAAGRDVRDLMGARQLHVIDVRDTDLSGKPQKAFGRVFLTEGKSLVFYAFDLNDGKLRDAKHSFQVWGEQADKKTSVRSLGLLYVDNKVQKRWALKVENPALLKEIDAVFVTLEPLGGGQRPTGQPLLYAYLGEANHP